MTPDQIRRYRQMFAFLADAKLMELRADVAYARGFPVKERELALLTEWAEALAAPLPSRTLQ